MVRTLIFGAAVLLSSVVSAQRADSVAVKKTYVKANALFVPVGILNAGVEHQLSEKMTLQADVFISPWKSFAGHYLQIYMAGAEGRYYFNEAFKKWYVGANFSSARYIIQKWNYWGNGPYRYTPESPEYRTSDLYQDGFAFMLGATVGYQMAIAPRWNVDLYMTAGTVQSFYKGFHKELGVRYDTDGRRYNRSGELIPYRGGIMVAYQL